MNEPAVSVNGLTKSFSGRRVVDGLSFQVQKGEVFALLGHNGAGKSTTIDLILGLKMPDGGSTRILGMNAAQNRKRVFERVGVQRSPEGKCRGFGSYLSAELLCSPVYRGDLLQRVYEYPHYRRGAAFPGNLAADVLQSLFPRETAGL